MNILGVDRCHLNGKIALASLIPKGVRFIWFKGTQGLTYQDITFNAAWQEAKGIPGLIRGAYHFFNPQADGIAQADNFLSLGINFSAPGCLPPCVDVEDLVGSNPADTAQLNKWVADNYQVAIQRLNDFLGHIKQKTGRDCLIYTYNNYPREYFKGYGFPNNPMWLSSIKTDSNPNCPNRYDTHALPSFWQWTYTWNGTDMDGNYFTGKEDEFKKLANIT